jgi:hypothetical protein
MSIIDKVSEYIRLPNDGSLYLRWIKDDFMQRSFVYNIFYSVLNPISIRTIVNQSELYEDAVYLIRDGYLDLLRFFLRNPQSNSKKRILIIPYPFRSLVPSGWNANVCYYQFNYEKKNKEINDVYLYLAVTDDVILNESLCKRDPFVSSSKKMYCLVDNLTIKANDYANFMNFVSQFMRQYENIEFVSDMLLRANRPHNNACFFEINSKHVFPKPFEIQRHYDMSLR